MSLPAAEVEQTAGTSISEVRRVGGGSINNAARLRFADGNIGFLKWVSEPPPRFFACEAAGLRALREAAGEGLHIPEVLHQHEGWLLLEWVEQGAKNDAAEALGRGLATLHKASQARYGWEADNYIGRLEQPNGWAKDWATFYGEKRLGAQLTVLERRGRLPTQRRKRLESIIEHVDRWLGDPAPALLHGDLWGGNWLADAQGRAALIDPAVYIGDREVDLAMSKLFGGFPSRFYAAYEEVYPLATGHEERLPLYQLYYLLVHVAIFGESYGAQTDSILRRYAD